MTKALNSIEINGRRYDAANGKLLSASKIAGGASMDGVVGKSRKVAAIPNIPKIAPAALQPLSHTKVMDMQAPKSRTPRSVAITLKRNPQSSHTLMRATVQKPTKSLKRQHKAQSHTASMLAQPSHEIAVKPSVASIPLARLDRAKKQMQAANILKFAKQTPQEFSTAISQKAERHVQVTPPVASQKPKTDIFAQAIERANSHTMPKITPKPSPASQKANRRIGFASIGLAVFLLIGFFGFENRTNLALHMASGKIGFAATVPGYQPSGFSLGHVSYTPGDVAFNFHSNSDQRSFAVVERTSDWDSETLRDNFVASADSNYQTSTVAGRTVYLYGKNNAAWVSGGIWYQVQSNGALSDQQLTQIAASI